MSYRLEAPWLRLFCPIPDVSSEYECRIGPYRGAHARPGTYVCICMRLIHAMSPAANCEHTLPCPLHGGYTACPARNAVRPDPARVHSISLNDRLATHYHSHPHNYNYYCSWHLIADIDRVRNS